MIWSPARPVTSAIWSNWRVKLPAPAVAERSSTINSPIPASGILARTPPHLHRADVVARYRAADHLLGELEAIAARQRLDVEHDIAELAVSARLLLVAAALDDRLADGLLIADRGWMRGDLDAEAIVQPLARD